MNCWGLDVRDNHKFSEQEVVFMFARGFEKLGFNSIVKIQQEYPDSIVKEGKKERKIEFEAYSNNFEDHIRNDKLSDCDYIVCWENDLRKDLLKKVKMAGIKIIELKKEWEKGQRNAQWDDAPLLGSYLNNRKLNSLKILRAFITADVGELDTSALANKTGIKGKALGGSLSSFLQGRYKNKIIKRVRRNVYSFNRDLMHIVRNVLIANNLL